jgi:ATP-binding cassette subfamily B protein
MLLSIWGHLSRRRRIQLGLLLVVMLASGVAELVSLGAVLPFLSVLSDPETLWHQPLVQVFAAAMSFTSATELLLPATGVFAAAAVLAGLIRLANIWLNGKLAAAVGSDLSCEAYKRTLFQPYAVHVQRNSAEVILGTTTQIGLTVEALTALLQLITAAIVASGLFIGLLVIDASVALSTAAVFGTAYWVLAVTARRELRRNSHKIAEASTRQLKALQEGLGAIRDVLLDGNQHTYLEMYRLADRPQRQLQAKNAFIAIFPRFALEAVALVAISLLGVLLVLQRGDGSTVIPLLGALALGGQRLLPALQQIYSGWASLKGTSAAIQAVLGMLNQPLPPILSVTKPIKLRACICFKGVHFCYSLGNPEVLRGLDMKIRRGERIGLTGCTGSGKSTALDLLMGLLAPTAGQVLVDGMNLYDQDHPERILAWRAAIAHVPQSIYLADSSFAENIAFGVPYQEIDFARVKQAASQAKINNFIEASPDGYASFVGERGIRLSGGQRQRIGIARALYRQAQVLVFDEATSALDISTEEAVMASINELSLELTVIIIAHRLSTVQRCDRVIRLENGKIVDDDIPEYVLGTDRIIHSRTI